MDANTKTQESSNQFDRVAANWISAIVGYPRIAIRLWNGTEYYYGDGPPVGTMEFHTRRALLDLVLSGHGVAGLSLSEALEWELTDNVMNGAADVTATGVLEGLWLR